MDKTTVIGVLKLAAAALALIGINFTEADQGTVASGIIILWTLLSSAQAYFTKTDETK